MASGLYRLGRWCFRHRVFVLVAWLVVLVGLGILATSVKQPLNNSFTIPGTESQQALDLLNQRFPGTGGTQAQVVFSVPAPGKLTDPANHQAIETTLAELRKDPQVVLVSDPFQTGTVSKDGRIAYSTVAYPVPVGSVTTAAKNALLDSGGPAKAAGISVNFGGQVAQASTASDTESIGILVAFVILLIGFGSIYASLLPLVAAIVGVAVTDLALSALTSVVNESSTTPILALMIGLAVGIDYSLFVMNRYRQMLIAKHSSEEAAARAVATSGSAVFFAGLTVLIALVALSIVNIPFLTVMGLAAAGAVVSAVAVATTLVPALLGFVGARTIRSRWATSKIAKTEAPGFVPLSRRYVGLLKRAPVVVTAVGVIVLLFVAAPFMHMRLGLPDAGSQPTSQTTRRAYDLISEGFGPGANGPLLVVVYAPGGATPAQVKGFTDYYTQTKEHLPPSIESIGNPIINQAKDVALITITPTTGPNDPATTRLINQIRQVAMVGQQKYGLETFVTGQTALNVDISAKLSSALPLYLAVIIILCVLILLLVFRSILVPLTAVAGYVLSVLAAFGAVTFVFQEGHFNSLFGIASPQPVLSFLPIILLGILFGLAMDYEVFLVSRMREEFTHEDDDAAAAVADGYVGSAKVVASAAIIMISVFASFIFSPDPTTKSLGFGLALGVLIDAFIIRMTVIPATMYLYGKAAWWLPRFLGRALPDIDIEGQSLGSDVS
jgi:RND superfamily putative drug exporter